MSFSRVISKNKYDENLSLENFV